MNIKALVAGRLNDHLDELRSFLEGLTEDQLLEQGKSGNLSLSHLAFHLFDIQDAYIGMTVRMLAEDRPTLAHPCLEAQAPSHTSQEEFRRRLKEFGEQRKDLVSLLNALTDEQWKREGVHDTIRHFNVEKCMEALMRHEEYHFYEMYKIFFGAADSA